MRSVGLAEDDEDFSAGRELGQAGYRDCRVRECAKYVRWR